MFQLVATMVIWGTLGVFALWSGLSAYELAFYRCVIGAIIMGGYCYWRQYFSKENINLHDMCYVVASGLFIVLNWILLFKSFQLASITIGNVSYYLQPIFLIILGIVFFKEQITPKQWLFILLTTVGVMLTSKPGSVAINIDKYFYIGVLCAVGAGALYSFATIFIKYIKTMPNALIIFLQLLAGVIILMPFMSVSDLGNLNSSAIKNILVIGIVHTALAYILYYKGLYKTKITLVAVISYIDPIVAIGTDILFFNMKLNALQTMGILLTFIGSYQVIRLKKLQDMNLTQTEYKIESA